MNRYKFRAWDTYTKKMIYESDVQKHNFCAIIRLEGDIVDIAFDRDDNLNDQLILMQYTGLHDKNGKEIYGDDIIKDPEGALFIVTWDYHNPGFFLKSTEDDEYNVEMIYILNNDVEVIGNIYENPELLKEVED